MATLTQSTPDGERTLVILTDRNFVVTQTFPGGEPISERLADGASAIRRSRELIANAISNGYQLPALEAATEEPRNAELEARLLADPDDTETFLVYADWLSARGNPRGEWINALHRIARGDTAAGLATRAAELERTFAAALDAMLDRYGLDTSPGGQPATQWVNGFVRSIRLAHTADVRAQRPAPDLRAGIRALVAHPSCRFLQEMRLGELVYGFRRCDYVEVIEALHDARPASLRRVYFGDVPLQRADAASERIVLPVWVGWLDGLGEALPNLESLTVQGMYEPAPLDLPKLESLEIRPVVFEAAYVQALADSTLPNLKRFALYQPRYDRSEFGSVLDEVLDVLAEMGTIRHLGLVNTWATDWLLDRVLGSRLMPFLESLDISFGTLRNTGFEWLAKKIVGLPRLRRVDLRGNLVTQVFEIDNTMAEVIATGQRPATLDAVPFYEPPN